MINNIVEENPNEGAADDKVRKQARQLAYDVRYKVKAQFKGGQKADPASLKRAYMSQLGKSPAPGPVKQLAKKMLIGEAYDFIDLDTSFNKTISNVINKVFVEGIEEEPEVLEEDGKYKVRVTDKKSGKSYVRMADRAKISELRKNPNISSVEMTGYGSPYDKADGKGSSKKKAKKDFDGDGKVESPKAEYKGSKDKAIKKALAKEGFQLDEADITDILARLEKKRISKGGNPDDSPLGKKTGQAMKAKQDAARKKAGVKTEEVELDEAERKLADRLARKRKVYDKTTKKAMDYARKEGEAAGHARYRMSSISREMDGIKAKMNKEGYQRDPEGSKKDKTHSKQPDPSKDGFTGIGNMSIKDIMKMNKKMKKEEVVAKESVGSAIDKGLGAVGDTAKVAGKAAVGSVKVASKVVKGAAKTAGRVAGTAVGAVKAVKKGFKSGADANEEVELDPSVQSALSALNSYMETNAKLHGSVITKKK